MEKFEEMLGVVTQLKNEGRWPEIQVIVGRWFEYLLGKDLDKYLKRTDTILLAGLLSRSITYAVPYRKVMLIRLLAEAGDIGRALFPPAGGYGWYLRALDLLAFSLARGDIVDLCGVLPSLESLIHALGADSIPAKTRILVIAECERQGEFGLMSAQLRAALQKGSKSPKLLAFGIGVFSRLCSQSDASLTAGGLSRPELVALLSELAALSTECCFPNVGYTEGVDKNWN